MRKEIIALELKANNGKVKSMETIPDPVSKKDTACNPPNSCGAFNKLPFTGLIFSMQ